MTTFKKEFSTEPSLASQSSCFDPIDSFINYDEAVLPTPSISPISTQSRTSGTPTLSSSQSNNTIPIQPSPQAFGPPSHQYEQYKQQTGLPVGALANTYGVNQADQFSFGRSQQYYPMMPPTDGYFGMNATDDFFNFGTAPTQTGSGDMDLDFGSPTDFASSNTDFVNPAAIVGQETTPHTLPSQTHPGRVYPGMHQQAALAKQQAMAQRQRDTVPSHSSQNSRGASSTRPATDPHVEESISRLLNQMRHSSVASSNDDDAATPTGSVSQLYNTRMRKDEEDMDEDERLLASEEGKKLSSKERRQLRNKVSARAFRSRRKEYIGQLEGEIAAKTQEADELRVKNEALAAENTRLADLTRMLLSSSAFSTFLEDLSSNGAPASMPELSQTQSHTQTPRHHSAAPRKDVNPNHAAPRKNNTRVGMTKVPEEPSFEFNAAESANNGYTDNTMDFGLYNAQVYSVTEVPQGPGVDTMGFAMLHGKASNFVGPCPSIGDAKNDSPAIESMPVAGEKVHMPAPIEQPSGDVDIDVSDPAFALFINQRTSSPAVRTSTVVAPEDRIFGEIELEKAFGRVELILEDDSEQTDEVSSATIERFERLCSRLDAASERVAVITARL